MPTKRCVNCSVKEGLQFFSRQKTGISLIRDDRNSTGGRIE